MVPVTCEQTTGYSSVYWFAMRDAEQIKARGHSRGLGEFSVYSNTLWFDFDGGASELDHAVPAIVGLNAPFRVFFSGKKGFHIAVEIEPMEGPTVPQQQKAFVQTLDFCCDLSLYQHSRILSNCGRVHPETGKPKRLLFEWVLGEPFKVPKLLTLAPSKPKLDETVDIQRAMFMAWRTTEKHPSPGNRHTTLWSLAKTFCNAELEYSTALDILLKINDKWNQPKLKEEVERACNQAFDREWELYNAK